MIPEEDKHSAHNEYSNNLRPNGSNSKVHANESENQMSSFQSTTESSSDRPQTIEEEEFTESFVESRNTFIFGILLILTQVTVCVVYGVLVKVPGLEKIDVVLTNSTINVDIAPVILAIVVSFVVIVGFGLLISYNRKNVWSALGFNLLIVSLTVELYFVLNHLLNFPESTREYSDPWRIYLTSLESHRIISESSSSQMIPYFGNTFVSALKCAFANCITFSCGIGRWGLLHLYLIVIVGTVLFEVNRRVIEDVGLDYADVCSVFIFASFYGLVLSCFSRIKEKSSQHPNYTGNILSVALSLMGSLFLIMLLPIFALNPTQRERSIFPRFMTVAQVSIYYSIFSSVMMGISFSFFINSKLVIRDLINSGVAGAISGLASVMYIDKPVYSMVVGSTSGIVQTLVQNLIEKSISRRTKVFSTYSWQLFGVQGLIGTIFGSIFKTVVEKEFNQPYARDLLKTFKPPIVLGLISVAIGIGGGILLGLLFYKLPKMDRSNYFHDRSHWKEEDNCFEDESVNNQNLRKFRPGILPYF